MAKELPIFDIAFTEGDRLPELTGTVKDLDLTGHTITLTLGRPTTLLVKTATLVSAADGTFKFEWDDDDLIEGLGQEALLQLTTPVGLTSTLLRFLIDVEALPTP